jgi:glycosyltransferase involved in cell wall biosynthesis
MMRHELLIISWIPPSFLNGGGIRVYYLLKELGRTFRTTFVCPQWGEQEAVAFPNESIEVVRLSVVNGGGREKSRWSKIISRDPPFASKFHLGEGRDKIEQLIRCGKFSGIQVFQAHMMLNLSSCAYSLPVHLDVFDILSCITRRDMTQSESPGEWLRTAVRLSKTEAWEKRILSKASFVSAVSEKDEAVIRRWHPGLPTAVVPNGADVERLRPPSGPGAFGRTPRSMIFVGSLGYQPNYVGVMEFVRRVLPLVRRRHPDASLTVAGSAIPSDLHRLAVAQGVRVVDSPEDIRPFLHQAQVSIVPIFNGGGTRIKILEASAAGAAVVATPVGAEGIRMRDGEHLLIREMPDAFADGIGYLFDHPEEGERMAARAARLVAEQYDWSVVSRPFLDAWDRSLRPANSLVGPRC